MTTTTNVSQVKLNIMTQSQYNSATKNANELYMITDAVVGTVTSVNNTQPDANGNVTISTGDSLPSQTGNSGKVLTTDGTDASWGSTSEIIPIIETYYSSGSYYRIYAPDSTGYRYCIQGGLWTNTLTAYGNASVLFLKEFTDTNYQFFRSPEWGTSTNATNDAYSEGCNSSSKSTTGVTFISHNKNYVVTFAWYARGYIVDDV